MGFFDTFKEKAGAFATDAERAGKVTAAQARLLVLQNDVRKAERDLGHAAAALIEAGELLHPDLGLSAARVRETREALRVKDAEIAALRAAGATSAATAPATAPAPTVLEEAAVKTPAADPAAAEPAARKQAAKKPAAKKASAKKTTGAASTAGGKAAPKKPTAKKPPARKSAATKPPARTE